MFSVGEGTTRRRVGGRDTGRLRARPLSRRAGSDPAGGGRIGLRVVRRRQAGSGAAARHRQPRPRLHRRGAGLGTRRAGLAGDPAFPQQELGPSGPARLRPGSRRRSTDPRPAGALDRRSRPAPGRSDALRPCQPPDRARCRHLARPITKGPRPGRRARGHPGRLARAAGRDGRFSHTMASRPHAPSFGWRRRRPASIGCWSTMPSNANSAAPTPAPPGSAGSGPGAGTTPICMCACAARRAKGNAATRRPRRPAMAATPPSLGGSRRKPGNRPAVLRRPNHPRPCPPLAPRCWRTGAARPG